MFIDGSIHQLPDIDHAETTEWLDSLDTVIDSRGKARAHYLLARSDGTCPRQRVSAFP